MICECKPEISTKVILGPSYNSAAIRLVSCNRLYYLALVEWAVGLNSLSHVSLCGGRLLLAFARVFFRVLATFGRR